MGSAYRGYLGMVHTGQWPKRAFCLLYWSSSMQLFKNICINLFLFFLFKFFFSCQVKQWLLCKAFPTLSKWWKASACDFFFFFHLLEAAMAPADLQGEQKGCLPEFTASLSFQSSSSFGSLFFSPFPRDLEPEVPAVLLAKTGTLGEAL